MEPEPTHRRPATDAEARALASTLRMRILRMTLDEALTNKQIAERLGRNPASVLHHVRTLVDTGFLVAGDPRRGPRGSREVPYRSTRKSWTLDYEDADSGGRLLLRTFLEESAGQDLSRVSRLGLRLSDGELDELETRLHAVLEEFAGREPTPGGRPWSLFLAIHEDPNRT